MTEKQKITIDGNYCLVLQKNPNGYIDIQGLPDDIEKEIINFTFINTNGMDEQVLLDLIKDWLKRKKTIQELFTDNEVLK